MFRFLLRWHWLTLLLMLPLAGLHAQNVGINTTTPTQALDVNGNLRVRNMSGPGLRLSQILPDGTLQASGPVPASATPTQPSPAGTVATGHHPAGVAVAGGYAYVSNQGTNTIQIYSLANPALPVSMGTVACITAPDALCAAGGYLYVCGSTGARLQVFSLATPAAPTDQGTIPLPGNPDGVAALGNVLYIANSSANTLLVYDLSNPIAPTSIGSVATAAGPGQLAVSGSYLYLACYTANVVQTFSLATPTAPTSLGTLPTSNQPNGVAALGGMLYVTKLVTNAMQTYSLATPATPTSQGSQPLGNGPYAVAGLGNYLYVVNFDADNLQVLQLAVPTVVGFDAGGNLASLPVTTLGDNLGNHTATQTLALNGNWLANQPGANTGLRIDNAGQVGIGVATPYASLEVVRGTGGNGTAAFHGSTRSSHFNFSSNEDTYIRGGKASSNVLLNDNGGNVGIGTATPNSRLSISPTVVEPKITLWDGGIATSHYGLGVSGAQLNYHVPTVGNNHVFYQGGKNGDGTQLMRLTGAGSMILGPSGSGTARLEVVNDGGGSGGVDDIVIRSYGSNTMPGIALQTFLGTQAAPSNLTQNTALGVIGFSGQVNGTIGGGFALSGLKATYRGDGTTSSSDLGLITSGVQQALLDPVGRLGLGTASPVARLDIASENPTDPNADDLLLRSYGSTSTPVLGIRRYRGTKAAPANLQAGDLLGEFSSTGYFNNTENSANLSGLQAYYQGDGSTSRSDLRLLSSGQTRVLIDPVGNVGVGVATPQAALEVARGSAANATAAFYGGDRISYFNFGSSESTYIRGGLPNSNVYLNDSGGGVAIGASAVTAGELLDVAGSTRTTGVHTPNTGSNNMLALAYGQAGNVTSTIYNGSGNVTETRIAAGHYRLTFTNFPSLSFSTMPVALSLNGAAVGFISSEGLTGGPGTLDVYTYSISGVLADRFFNFAVYKP